MCLVSAVGLSDLQKDGGGRRQILQMRTARDENVPRFVVVKPRPKGEPKVIYERKAVA